MNSKTALLVGGTGLVGKELLELLLKNNMYSKVLTINRSPLERDHPKLDQILINFDSLASIADKIKADDVFCCLGTTISKAGSKENFKKVDLTYPYEVARLALQNNAKRYFLITAMGADKNSKIFYNQVKGEVEEAISTLNYHSFNVFRPSLILGARNEKRFGEAAAKWLAGPLSFILTGPFKKYRPIQAKTIAEGMIKLASSDQLSGMKIIESEEIKVL